ncbi:MAG: FG-GAP-like repeat-containing protein [Planctomycetota bacterium]
MISKMISLRTLVIVCASCATVVISCSSGTAPNPNGNSGSGNVNDNIDSQTPRTGACCEVDGPCTVTEQAACVGTYQGDDSNCDSNPCPTPTGACCLDDGSCLIASRADCAGAYAGTGTACDANVCSISPFTEEAELRGIDLQVIYGRCPESGSGVALVDLDNDGDADLVALGQAGDGVVGIYENDGRGFFTDLSASSGIPASTTARGISAADFDDDGDLDLYFSKWLDNNMLVRNDGGFHFTDVTEPAGVGGFGHGAGSAWGDYDGDGWVDLYVANWEYTDVNFLYHNLGNGTFEEVGAAMGVDCRERSYQPVFIDFDKDNDLDLYVSNDNRRSNCGLPGHYNRLFLNTAGVFTDASAERGADICLNSMGIAVGDFDNNLSLDLHFTNLPWGNMVLMNQGDGTFMEEGERTGINTLGHIGWGTIGFDYDNDGFEEIFVADANTADRFYENDGTFPLRDIALELGLDGDGESYCVAVADIDNDGDLDMVESIRQEKLKLFINHEGQKRHWVKFRVVGLNGHDRFGIGTMVTIRTGDARQIRELMFGNNYKSQNEGLLHFGVRAAGMVDEIMVVWMGGVTRTIRNYPVDQTWTLYPPQRLGDVDNDGSANDTDRAAFAGCMGPIRVGCEALDFDGNGVVDQVDVSLFP